ncbi:MAG: GDP-L-fucose synthase, partial [Candidatus Cloacimonetes bacterium]|nr:GDP-L-fucose synthase [Candidatus Cloacimonadota bacterium]
MVDLKSSKIVVTGGAGFVGKNVISKLKMVGAKDDNIFVPRSKDYNLTCETNVIRMYRDMKPDVVIHLAASVGGIGANRENPGKFFYDNMIMGVHLIEHARHNRIKKFVQVGTICAYPKMTTVPFREEDLWNGYPEETNAPYGVAKKALLVMLQAYRKQYSLNGIYLLPVNLYGPGDNFNPDSSHVIPALIRKFQEAKDKKENKVVIWGDGKASREFLYVDDCARAIVMATRDYDHPEPVNVGAGFEITIYELATKIAKLMKFKGELCYDLTKPNGQPRRCLNTQRALNEFGFVAETSF